MIHPFRQNPTADGLCRPKQGTDMLLCCSPVPAIWFETMDRLGFSQVPTKM
jgi:hypothetical protein